MRPHTPQERRAIESPEWMPPASQNDPQQDRGSHRLHGTGHARSFLVLVAIVALVVLL